MFTRNVQILALIEKYDPIFLRAQAERHKEIEQQVFANMSKPLPPILFDTLEEERDGHGDYDFRQATAARGHDDESQVHSHLTHSSSFSRDHNHHNAAAVGLNRKNLQGRITQTDMDLLVVHNDNDSEQDQDRRHSVGISGDRLYFDNGEERGTSDVTKQSDNLTHYRMAVDAVKTMKNSPLRSSANGSDGRSNNGVTNSPVGSNPGSPTKTNSSTSPTDLNNDLLRTFARTQLERRHTPASVDMWTARESDVRPSTGVGRHNNTANSASSRGGTGSSHDSSRGSSRGAGGSAVGKSRDSNDVDEYRERANGSYGIAGDASTAAAAINQRPIFANIMHLCAFSSWGDPSYFGVSGMAAMDGKLQEFQLPVPDIFVGEVNDDVRGGERGEECVIVRLGHPMTDIPPENIINGLNLTTNASFMWRAAKPELMSSKKKKNIALIFQFEFDRTVELKGLRLWNYNEGREESTCGLKHVNIYVDWKLRCSTVVRKAPGEFLGKFDYAQFLSLVGTKPEPDMLSRSAKSPGSPGSSGRGGSGFGSMLDLRTPVRNEGFSPDISVGSEDKKFLKDCRIAESSSSTKRDGRRKLEDSPDDGMVIDACDIASESSSSVVFSDTICRVSQQYETPVNPTGCMVKIVIRSTHGDPHYVGLNGIALYDSSGVQVAISPDQLQATPSRYTTDLTTLRCTCQYFK